MNAITYYRQHAPFMNGLLDEILEAVKPEPGDDPAVTFDLLVMMLDRDRDKGMTVGALALMRLAGPPPAPEDKPVTQTDDVPGRPGAATIRCSHGGDCQLHPEVRGLHDFTPKAAEVIREALVRADAYGRGTLTAAELRTLAAEMGVEV